MGYHLKSIPCAPTGREAFTRVEIAAPPVRRRILTPSPHTRRACAARVPCVALPGEAPRSERGYCRLSCSELFVHGPQAFASRREPIDPTNRNGTVPSCARGGAHARRGK